MCSFGASSLEFWEQGGTLLGDNLCAPPALRSLPNVPPHHNFMSPHSARSNHAAGFSASLGLRCRSPPPCVWNSHRSNSRRLLHWKPHYSIHCLMRMLPQGDAHGFQFLNQWFRGEEQIVRRIPSILSFGLICLLTLLMVPSSCSRPFAGRYAAWTGISTLSATANSERAFSQLFI